MQTSLKISFSHNTAVIEESVLITDLASEIETMPTPTNEIMPGVHWGYYSQLFTPAYWKLQYMMYNHNESFIINYRIGENILEEVVACLLGGFGLKAEIGLAAFYRLKQRGQIRYGVSLSSIIDSLTEPLVVNNKKVHYRFPNQKAKFIASFLNRDDLASMPLGDDSSLRTWLLKLPGIGPKTASWITRNYLDSERVAIIDVHIFRAGLLMGLFPTHFDIQKDYFKLEEIFLQFCEKLGVKPSKMDALMWMQMKESGIRL